MCYCLAFKILFFPNFVFAPCKMLLFYEYSFFNFIFTKNLHLAIISVWVYVVCFPIITHEPHHNFPEILTGELGRTMEIFFPGLKILSLKTFIYKSVCPGKSWAPKLDLYIAENCLICDVVQDTDLYFN